MRVHTRTGLSARACVRDGVEDGAEGGWYLVGGREIRAGERGSSNSLRARSNREEADERQGGGEQASARGTEPSRGLLRLFAPPSRCAL